METHREFSVRSARKIHRIDITGEVAAALESLGARGGFALVSVPHTTAAVTLGENWDDDVGSDLERALARWVPGVPFRHSEGNSPAHFLSEAFGASRWLVVQNGKPRLGRWQGIFLVDFDGPRLREVWVDVAAAPPGVEKGLDSSTGS